MHLVNAALQFAFGMGAHCAVYRFGVWVRGAVGDGIDLAIHSDLNSATHDLSFNPARERNALPLLIDSLLESSAAG